MPKLAKRQIARYVDEDPIEDGDSRHVQLNVAVTSPEPGTLIRTIGRIHLGWIASTVSPTVMRLGWAVYVGTQGALASPDAVSFAGAGVTVASGRLISWRQHSNSLPRWGWVDTVPDVETVDSEGYRRYSGGSDGIWLTYQLLDSPQDPGQNRVAMFSYWRLILAQR